MHVGMYAVSVTTGITDGEKIKFVDRSRPAETQCN
jgi:hypothetical protein